MKIVNNDDQWVHAENMKKFGYMKIIIDYNQASSNTSQVQWRHLDVLRVFVGVQSLVIFTGRYGVGVIKACRKNSGLKITNNSDNLRITHNGDNMSS